MNYFNYLKHSIFTPETYHRRYENDWEEKKPLEEGSLSDVMRRTALSSLPFIALYRPAGFVLSMGMGSCRVVSHLASALSNEQNGQWTQMGSQLLLATLAVASVASTVWSFGVGLAFTTLVDTAQGLLHAVQYGWQGNYDKGFEELLQALSSGLYLGFMSTGALEVILLSTLIQGLTSLYQTRQEIGKGHYIEAGAKVLLAGVRGHQVSKYREMIQKRDLFLSLRKYQDLVAKAVRGKEVRHLLQHQLIDLNGKMEEKKVTLSNQEHDYDFGSHFHGYGKGVVKGANLSFRTVVIEGQEMTELQFKVNHVAREKLEKVVDDLSYLRGKEVEQVLSLTGSHATQISVDRKGSLIDFFGEGGKDPVLKVTLEGLGSVSIGACGTVFGEGPFNVPNLYDKVVVHMQPDKTLYDFHELMAFLDLESALCVSTDADLERLKLGHLFRTFFPRAALPLERSTPFFDLPVNELKQVMIEKAPEMQEIYDTYFHRMTPFEILPGRVRYQINGLADQVKGLGMTCLTTAVTGPQDDQSLFSRIASMFSMGMVSTELRDAYHVNAEGLSKIKDYSAGGADSVYFQLMPERFASEEIPLEEFSWYESRVRLQISLKVLETGTFQYASCGLGNRDVVFPDGYRDGAQYPDRLNILEFAQKLRDSHGEDWSALRAHEIMVKERVALDQEGVLEGMWLANEATKEGLLTYLRKCDIVKKSVDGGERIFNVPVDEFMRVARK